MLKLETTQTFKVTLTAFQGKYLLLIDTLPSSTSKVVLRVATTVYGSEEAARSAYEHITSAALATIPKTWTEPVAGHGQITSEQAEAAVENYLESLKQPDE